MVSSRAKYIINVLIMTIAIGGTSQIDPSCVIVPNRIKSYNDYMMAKRRKAFRRAAKLFSRTAWLFCHIFNYNKHRANDSFNHLLPNLSFGSESNRIFDCFRYAMIIMR